MGEITNLQKVLLSSVLIVMYFFGLPAQAKYGGGSGTAGDPYLIYTAEQMNAIGADSNDWDKHFRLMSDIDLGGYTGTSFNIIGSFSGVFDGGDHTISNFTYESNDISYIGLFGYVSGENTEIKDLGLINPNIDAGTGSRVGSLVGRLFNGTISGCYVNEGSVSGNSHVGGLAGTIGFGTYPPPLPPPVPHVTNCGAIVDVTGDGDRIGGLIGEQYRGTISDCYAAGNTVSSGDAVGGLVGLHAMGAIYNSYATGTIFGTHKVGGLVGESFSGVTNCYSIGGVEGANAVGGLVGSKASGTISYCYSTGSVVGANDVGGLIGINEYGTVVSSFWDVETSGLNNMCGGQHPDGSGCDNSDGKTTGQMQTEITFTDAGWDFVGETANGTEDIWKMCEWQDYPKLSWQVCMKYGGGSGTAKDPYLIYNANQMNAIGANSNDWDKHFKLMNNIDLSGYTGTEFNIIGRSLAEAFLGTFNGNGHTISNFSYSSEDIHKHLVGIFGYVNSPSALVTDLVLIDPNIETKGLNIGSLIGYLCTGTVKDCYVKGGRVSGGAQVGGLVGDIYKGAISNCGSINCTVISQEGWIGGLVGVISSSSGPIMSNCFSQGGSVTGRSSSGGLLGVNFGAPISYSYSTTNVYGIYLEGHYGIGGLVGYSQIETISDCYATGDVQGYGTEVGGLVGFLQGGMVSRCYSSGKVSGSGTLGGLIGDNNVGNGEVAVSFWDNQTSLQKISAGGTGLSTEEMQTESTFTDAGWDFATRIWKMCDGPYYPRLWWEICPVRPVYYVDADANGANNGSSWANAFTELDYALFIARYGDEIHVAQGTYKPIPHTQPPPPPIGESNYSDMTVTDSNRTATFQLINGVTIKGGYAGFGEPDPDARDIHLYETILSGDLDGNDVPGLDPCDLINHHSRAENSYHVVTGSGCDESAVLDGFTITGGNANGSHQNYYDGGGIYNDNGSPTLLNCTLASNSAKYYGGGIYNHNGNPKLTKCLFSGNLASSGGGIYNLSGNLQLTYCLFSNNWAWYAGGIRNDGGNPALTNCLFSGNRAGEDAGTIYNICGIPKLTNCTFYANSAGRNTGGIFTINPPAVPPSPPVPIITNCIFWGNRDRNGTTQAAQISWQAGEPLVNFCCIQGWTGTLGGTGNIGADPCFADANNGDCHLKSKAGRWDANSQTWIKDDVNSPCIDAGDPNYDWRGELWPHGKRINMGAYGGTPEASMSLSDAANIADLNLDGLLCYRDMKLLTDKWLCETALQAEDLSRDGFVNFTDYAIFAHIWELPARHPNPADGATGVNITAELSWTAGRGATSHDVYFGTSSQPPFIGNQSSTTFDPGTMDYITTYYWRIDEVNQWGTTTGPVWSFTTIMSPPPP